MSNTGPFDALITEWQRPLQMTAHALAENRNFKNLRPEEKGRANGVINALVNAGMNKLDIACLLGIEEWGKTRRPFQLQELPAKGRMTDEQIETHRLRMGLRAMASDRRTSRIVPAEEARKRRPDIIDVGKIGIAQQSTFAFVKSSDPGAPLKLDVVPIEALPAAIEAARDWIKGLAIGGPDNDPYQNILWATAERFDISVEEAQKLLLRRLDYWTANLPGQEAQRPSRSEFPSIAASIDDLPMPTRDMRVWRPTRVPKKLASTTMGVVITRQ